MTDPALALDEQVCLARTYGVTDSDALAAALKGVTAAQRAELRRLRPSYGRPSGTSCPMPNGSSIRR